jgi:hypothetical protein
MAVSNINFDAIRRALHSVSAASRANMRNFHEVNARLGMSPRQQHLNRLWSYFTANHYDIYKFDFDGRTHDDPVDHEAIVSGNTLPPGFYDAAESLAPLKYRRPGAPYHLSRAVVQRFTGLLFSEKRHPKIVVKGDQATEDFVNALATSARVWAKLIQARNYGGATGTVAIGFQFVDGKPVVEVHDPRWFFPVFTDRESMKLKAFEKRYLYPVEEFNPDTARWEAVPYWYRRVVTETQDILYKPVKATDETPEWVPEKDITHNLGFCPAVWIQNLPVQDDVDGESDCHGMHEMGRMIDMLLSESSAGTLASCDPTLFIKTNEKMKDVRKGRDNAIKLTGDGDAHYLEIAGSGPDAAQKRVEFLRKLYLEIVSCVLEHPDSGGERTATEIVKVYESMFAKADVLREQYGENGLKPLLTMMVEASRKLTKPTLDAVSGKMIQKTISLPPKIVTDKDLTQRIPHKLGLGDDDQILIDLDWPPYVEPTTDDAAKASTAATTAKTGGIIDTETAVKFVAPFFGIDDATAMAEKLDADANAREEKMAASMGMGGIPPAKDGEEEEQPDPNDPTKPPAPNQPPHPGQQPPPFGKPAAAPGAKPFPPKPPFPPKA